MRLVEKANKIARPVAVYRSAEVEERQDDQVWISGYQFTSQVLRVNLEQATRVFPFVATCGMELQAWGESIGDWMWGYWAEAIKEEALRKALEALQGHLQEVFHLERHSTMSPGSLESWPISQQSVLFELLDSGAQAAGVRLTESLLMVPTKSVSGIVFPIDHSFESCMLCNRENCPGRRAPYDETLFAREYCPAGHLLAGQGNTP